MSKSNRTIRWDDPAFSAKSSEDSSSVIGPNGTTASLSNSSISGLVPAGNLAMKPQQTLTASNAVTSTSWRELKTRDGRVYFYNSVTQKTVWDMPQEYRDYLEFSRTGGGTRKGSQGSSEVDSEETRFFGIF